MKIIGSSKNGTEVANSAFEQHQDKISKGTNIVLDLIFGKKAEAGFFSDDENNGQNDILNQERLSQETDNFLASPQGKAYVMLCQDIGYADRNGEWKANQREFIKFQFRSGKASSSSVLPHMVDYIDPETNSPVVDPMSYVGENVKVHASCRTVEQGALEYYQNLNRKISHIGYGDAGDFKQYLKRTKEENAEYEEEKKQKLKEYATDDLPGFLNQ